MLRGIGLATAFAALPLPAMAEAATAPNSGDTAWVIAASALVLLMTLPGLAMFYAGQVRAQAVLSVVMHCLAIACLSSVLWLAAGYSLAFGDSVGGIVGGFGKAFFAGVGPDALRGAIPEIVFAVFQMGFAIVAPALMLGAWVERIRFPVVLIVSGAWLLLVYAPVCHWVRGGGWLAELGVMDFAGGLVVHACAGISALTIAKLLGGRRGFPGDIPPPHNPGMTAFGAALLWVGWFGFSGGSALAADATAGMAMAATHIAAASAAMSWAAIEWIRSGKASLVGAVTGAVSGLAASASASGFIGPVGALALGAVAGAVCFAATETVRKSWKIDDSLGVFAVHGVGGVAGTLLVAVLASQSLGGPGLEDGVAAGGRLGVQALGVLAVAAWAAVGTFVIVKAAGALAGGLRVDEEDELVGLDLAAHGERGYDL
ncbi:MAG: ammonium transporter [Alphaproteobacteria bacterium]|nr:ammonium transporter [Alphaproteobacteria bacterium]